MAKTQVMHFCERCDKKTVHITDSVNHLLHWILVFISAGFWFIPYLFTLLFVARERHCTSCGKDSTVLGLGTIVLVAILIFNYSSEIKAELSGLFNKLGLLIDLGWNSFVDSAVPWLVLMISVFGSLMLIASFMVGFFARPSDYKLRLKRSTHNLTKFYWFSYFTGFLFVGLSFLLNVLRVNG